MAQKGDGLAAGRLPTYGRTVHALLIGENATDHGCDPEDAEQFRRGPKSGHLLRGIDAPIALTGMTCAMASASNDRALSLHRTKLRGCTGVVP